MQEVDKRGESGVGSGRQIQEILKLKMQEFVFE